MSRPLAVVVLLRRSDGRYLFVRRAPARPASGYWTPVSGRPRPDETLEQAARRELLEETGLHAGVLSEVARAPAEGAPFELVYFAGPLAPHQEAPGEVAVVLQADEVDAHRWVALDELVELKPAFETTRTVLRAVSGLQPWVASEP